MNERPDWRAATWHDLDTIVAIQDQVHTLEPEGRDVFAAKLRIFPQGSLVLAGPGGVVGYGIFHPWRLHHAPPLHNLPFVIPDPADCLFVHDVALLPEARRQGAVRRFTERVEAAARATGYAHLALVSVYDTTPFWARLGFAEIGLPFDDVKRAQYGPTACYMVAAIG